MKVVLADGEPEALAAAASELSAAGADVTAIADETFFIFTHPELKHLIQARMEDILQERNPVLPSTDQP